MMMVIGGGGDDDNEPGAYESPFVQLDKVCLNWLTCSSQLVTFT